MYFILILRENTFLEKVLTLPNRCCGIGNQICTVYNMHAPLGVQEQQAVIRFFVASVVKPHKINQRMLREPFFSFIITRPYIHTSAATLNTIQRLRIQILRHPSNSPDLTRHVLRGCFENDDEQCMFFLSACFIQCIKKESDYVVKNDIICIFN